MLPSLYQTPGDILNIAHRGASAYYPENTMAAFRAAVDMQADMIELDVSLSKDGILVVIHDETLNRTTNGKGYVGNYNLSDLQKLDAGSWFDSTFAGAQIPTLEEVLAFACDKIALNIEIKPEAVSDELRGGIEEKSLKLVHKYGMENHVLFSSFDYRSLQHVKTIAPDMSAALLYNRTLSFGKQPSELVDEYTADAFNCSYRQLTKKRLKDLRSNDIPFFIYTVDQPRRMKKLIEKGAAGIFTNKPDLLQEVISNWNQDGKD